MYPAAVLANHLAGLGKAESGAGLLRRVVRIEDAFFQFVGDAGAGVDDVDSDQGVALHAHAGYQLAAFTINDPKRARRLIALGVDCIITDRPDLIAKAVG